MKWTELKNGELYQRSLRSARLRCGIAQGPFPLVRRGFASSTNGYQEVKSGARIRHRSVLLRHRALVQHQA